MTGPPPEAPVADGGPAPPEPSTRRRFPVGLVLLFLLALGIRLAYLIEIRSLADYLVLDSRFYYDWADAILHGNWFGDRIFDQSPLYAYVLAAFLGVLRSAGTLLESLPFSSEPLFWVRALQAGLGAYGCVLLVQVARHAATRAESWVAGVLAALYGPFIYYDTMIMKTFLTTLLSLLCLLSLYRSRGVHRRALIAGGLFLGLTALVRDNFILMYPFLLLGLLPALPAPKWQALRRAAGWLAVGTACVILPITVRNLVVGGELSLLTAGGGEVFYIGNNPEADGRYRPPCIGIGGTMQCVRGDPRFEHDDFRRLAAAVTGENLTPMQSSRYWLRRGLGFIVRHPVRYAILEVKKLGTFLKDREIGDNYDYGMFRRISRVLAMPLPTFGIVISLALAGILCSLPRWRRFALFYSMAGGYVATLLLFFNFSRFRIPAVAVLILFAGVALVWFARRIAAIARAVRGDGFPAAVRSGAILLLALVGVGGLTVWSRSGGETTILLTVQREVQLADLLRRTHRPRRALAEYEKARYLLGDAPIEDRLDLLNGTPVDTFRRILEDERVSHGLNFRVVHAKVYEGMGLTWKDMGNLDRAAESLEESIRIFIDGPALPILLAEIYQETGDPHAAGRNLQRALKMEESFSVRYDLAGILFKLGDPARAYSLLLEAPERNPDMTPAQLADYHFGLALILLEGLDQPQKARRHLESCLRLAPDHPQADEIRATLRRLGPEPGSP